jgi:hypothetical protein
VKITERWRTYEFITAKSCLPLKSLTRFTQVTGPNISLSPTVIPGLDTVKHSCAPGRIRPSYPGTTTPLPSSTSFGTLFDAFSDPISDELAVLRGYQRASSVRRVVGGPILRSLASFTNKDTNSSATFFLTQTTGSHATFDRASKVELIYRSGTFRDLHP